MNENKQHFECQIPAEYANWRLDRVVAQLMPDYSRAQWQHWIESGYLSLDQQIVRRPRHRVKPEQHLSAQITFTPTGNWEAQPIPLDVVFEDEHLIVINKPAGLVVHPGAGQPDGTLINALLHHDPRLRQIPRAGLIHRLDKDTSGLLLIARTLTAHQACTQALKDRDIERHYEAIVHGTLIAGGHIEAPLGRHPTKRTHQAVRPDGRPAITHYRVQE